MIESEIFQKLIYDVQELKYGDEKKLMDIIGRTKNAIIKTFGKQYDYILQLNEISFSPSIYEITHNNHFKEQTLREIADKSPQEIWYLKKESLESHEQLPPEIESLSPEELKEYILNELKKNYQLEERSMKEAAWSSGIKYLLYYLNKMKDHICILECESDALKFRVKGKYLSIYRDNNKIITIRINPIRDNPNKGELDVFIDAAHKLNFSRIQIHQANTVLNYENVHSCSWHGYYKERGSDLLYPVINLKDESGNKIPGNEVRRHNAIVHQRSKIAIPICAIDVPQELKLRDRSNRSNFAVSLNLFILPKNISWKKFAETTVYRMYYIHEHMSCFSPYLHGMLSCGFAEGCIVDINPIEFKFKEGQWDAIVRCIYFQNQSTDYSVCFYATRNPIDYALNRGFSEGIQNTPYGEEVPAEKQSFRDLHEIELRRLGVI